MARTMNQKSAGAEASVPAMDEAIALLRAERVPFRQSDRWTLKFGPWNYWPAAQRLYRDGDETSLRNQGLPEIKSLIDSLRRAPRPRAAVRSPDQSTNARPLTLQFIEE
jgi:hypothetical protein